MKVSQRNVESFLKIFGGTLESLTFESCRNINLKDLSSCANLMKLEVLERSSLIPPENESQVHAASFLPKLKELSSDICLGNWNRVFETKSELTSVTLNCCHIGTGVSCSLYTKMIIANKLHSIFYFI